MSDPFQTTARQRREPTGMNIYGETMAEYYQRRTNERGAVIERAREALFNIQDAAAADGVGMDAAILKMWEALRDVGR